MDLQERKRAIQTAIAQMEKQFGKGQYSGWVPRPQCHRDDLERICFARPCVGRGGFPTGRVVEVFGPESSGKTTLALQVIAQAQAEGGTAAFIDAEHALDPITPGNSASMSTTCWFPAGLWRTGDGDRWRARRNRRRGYRRGRFRSRPGPESRTRGDMGDSHVGLHARLMSQALRKLTASVSRTNTCLVFINQIREKIGVMFGNPETTTGGRALKFFSSVRVEVRRTGAIKDGESVIGNRTRIKVVKNKVAAPVQRGRSRHPVRRRRFKGRRPA